MTAVEWLEQQLYKAGWEKLNHEEKMNICCTAKDMEKEQIYKALIQGNKDCNAFTTTNKCEEYYNENYKSEQ